MIDFIRYFLNKIFYKIIDCDVRFNRKVNI